MSPMCYRSQAAANAIAESSEMTVKTTEVMASSTVVKTSSSSSSSTVVQKEVTVKSSSPVVNGDDATEGTNN